MKKKKVKLKFKKKVIVFFKFVGFLCIVFIIGFFIYSKQLNKYTSMGYSKEASKRILFSDNKDYILSVGENKTLNAAFESDDLKEKYLNNYAKIKYQNHENLIRNINLLLDKGYSNSDVSVILEHGNDKEVYDFSKRERVKYLEEFYQYPYAKLQNYDRYIAYTDLTGEDEKTTVIHVNLDMDKEIYVDTTLVTEFSEDMLVNKYRYLSEDYEPDDLVDIPLQYTEGEEMKTSKVSLNALTQLIEAAKIDGMQIVVNSAYRSYQDQVDISEFYRKWYGDNYVNNYVARPGFSEHQTGLAFDLGSATVDVFANSSEYKWMQENAYKYGFIMRFYKKAELITGFKSEPWHYRYVGKEIAQYIHENNITFEEYYVMFLDN